MQIFFPTEMMDMGISIAGKSKFLFYTITDIRTGLEDCHFGRKAKMAFETPVFHTGVKFDNFRCRCLFTIYYLRYPYDYASPITRRIHFCCNQSLFGYHQLILAHSQNAFTRSTLKFWNFPNFLLE